MKTFAFPFIRSAADWWALWERLQDRGPRLRLRPMYRAALVSQSDECLEWPGYRTPEGYGKMQLDGWCQHVHRLTCAARHGEPGDPTHHAAHTCDNPPCCNPRHMRWATPLENFRDQLKKGPLKRWKGEANVLSKLTDSDIVDIRSLATLCSQEQLAKAFGVTLGAVQHVIHRKTWRHLP